MPKKIAENSSNNEAGKYSNDDICGMTKRLSYMKTHKFTHKRTKLQYKTRNNIVFKQLKNYAKNRKIIAEKSK